jgi:hypothetical protein
LEALGVDKNELNWIVYAAIIKRRVW